MKILCHKEMVGGFRDDKKWISTDEMYSITTNKEVNNSDILFNF